VSSGHDSREACEGRAVLLREKGASVQCVEQKQPVFSISGPSGSFLFCSNGKSPPC
jgi:hypothetical protein